jgi:hypothetical protein
MPPYGGFFMAVNPLQKHIFRGALALAWAKTTSQCLK